MEILRIDLENLDMNAVRWAAAQIGAGGLVIFPTETVYGLAADALNEDAVRLVFEAKGRPQNQPLPVQIADIEQLGLVAARVPDQARILIEKYFPGPLTVILPRSAVLPELVTVGKPTVGVRMPDHPVALALIREFGGPIIATSANASGQPEPITAQEAVKNLGAFAKAAIDSGPARLGCHSTVIDMTVSPPRILRTGAVPAAELRALLGEVRCDE